MRKYHRSHAVLLTILMSLLLQGCAQSTLSEPCNNFGKYCDPKIKINQWTPDK